MKHFVKTILVLVTAGVAGPLAATDSASSATLAPLPDDPVAVVRVTSNRILEIAQTSAVELERDPESFYTRVQAVLDPVMDFDRFARNVMGQAGKRASDQQKQRFAETFKVGLVRTYASALTEFKDGKIEVMPSKRPSNSPDKADVLMNVHHGNALFSVTYRMGKDADGAWRARNIVVEGVNIGLSYRSQFASAMKDPRFGGDVDKVIDAWATVIDAAPIE